MKSSVAKRALTLGSIAMLVGALVPMAVASPAQAAHMKHCKWAAVAYDPATHTTTVACVGANRI